MTGSSFTAGPSSPGPFLGRSAPGRRRSGSRLHLGGFRLLGFSITAALTFSQCHPPSVRAPPGAGCKKWHRGALKRGVRACYPSRCCDSISTPAAGVLMETVWVLRKACSMVVGADVNPGSGGTGLVRRGRNLRPTFGWLCGFGRRFAIRCLFVGCFLCQSERPQAAGFRSLRLLRFGVCREDRPCLGFH